jgi:hypothetical protein
MAKILAKTTSVADRLECFRQFILERERIRRQKESGVARPWTNDPILQEYHFCNVCRADDRVTKWIGRWAKRWDESDRWFAYVVARWINEPDTLEQLPTEFNAKVYKAKLKSMIDNKQKVFRASYIINGFPNMPKYVSVVDKVLLPLWKNGPDSVIVKHSMEESHSNLMAFPGMGSFMSGQIVADWQTFGILNASDRYEWAPIGPGSARGIQWVFGLEKLPKQQEAVELMRQARNFMRKVEPSTTTRLILHDIQNCFCEMSKYVRGYSKTKYKPFQESFV